MTDPERPPVEPLREAALRAVRSELSDWDIDGEKASSILAALDAALASPAASETLDMRICRLHRVPQDDPTHDYKYPDCERAGFDEVASSAAPRSEGLDVETLAWAAFDVAWAGYSGPDRPDGPQAVDREYAVAILARLSATSD